MKKSFTLFILVFLSFASLSAQTAGGYSKIPVTSPKARLAAAKAVSSHSSRSHGRVTLVRITKAEQQVVAGMNYRVCMDIRDRKGTVTKATAVVFLNLKQKLVLTDWKSGGCFDL